MRIQIQLQLAEVIFGLDDAGYKIVMHTHDEVVLDVPNGLGFAQ